MSARVSADPETVRRAVAMVDSWRADDHQMPIPDNQWGFEFAFAIDVLLGQASQDAEERS